jgi:hypothetical protein
MIMAPRTSLLGSRPTVAFSGRWKTFMYYFEEARKNSGVLLSEEAGNVSLSFSGF